MGPRRDITCCHSLVTPDPMQRSTLRPAMPSLRPTDMSTFPGAQVGPKRSLAGTPEGRQVLSPAITLMEGSGPDPSRRIPLRHLGR